MSNQSGGYVLLARLRARAGQERELAKRMQSAVAGTRAEPGNRQYEFYGDQEDPLNFMLYEEFADEAAHQAHRERPEMVATLQAIKPMLDGAPDMSSWSLALTNAGAGGGKPGDIGHVTLVRFRAKAESVGLLLNEIGGDLDRMDGNIRFDLNRSRNDPLDCMICARWVSRAIWEAHNAKPEFKTFAARVGPWLDVPMRRTLWQPAAL
jgi:quinol monooxygenase YgiN